MTFGRVFDGCVVGSFAVGQDGRISSFFVALWWATATITTVGYGDAFSITTAGRVIGGVTTFVGISTFAVATAKVAEWQVRGESAFLHRR